MATETPNDKWKSRLSFTLLLVAVLILFAFPLFGDGQRSTIGRILHDPVSILSRSPRDHRSAMPVQTRIRKHIADAGAVKLLDKQKIMEPEEVALDHNVFANVGATPLSDPGSPPEFAGPSEVAEADIPPPSSHSWPGDGGFFLIGPGGNIIGGGNGGGIGDTGGKGGECVKGDERCAAPVGLPTPPIVAIPEPATWLLIIAGFFSLGGLMRFVRRSRASDTSPQID